ncbi:MAG: polysaccharide deacetylase family protein, partial [Flavobacterium sp.]
IPRMLELFEKNNISVTWATVGMLFNENWEEWQANIPEILPSYTNVALNPYEYGKKHVKSGLDHYFFAPNLIRLIQNVKGQEIATHTYSHYYCLETGQTVEQFRADMEQAVKIARKFDIELKSLVFPRNQFNKDYLDVCRDNQIETVRTNPPCWYWDTTKPETFFTKFARTGDAYFPFGKRSYSFNEVEKSKVVGQPASRFLRPQQSSEFLNNLRLLRIKNEMMQAAKDGEVYHLWWHPHNFGTNTEGAFHSLKAIMDIFALCREKYGMESQTMKELKDRVFDAGKEN